MHNALAARRRTVTGQQLTWKRLVDAKIELFDLIGKPYAVQCDPPNSFNCWELVLYIRKHYLQSPIPHEAFAYDEAFESSLNLEAAITDAKGEACWLEIGDYSFQMIKGVAIRNWQEGDVILMRQDMTGFHHCGIFIHGIVMHAFQKGLGGMVMSHEPPALQRIYNEVKAWRYQPEH